MRDPSNTLCQGFGIVCGDEKKAQQPENNTHTSKMWGWNFVEYILQKERKTVEKLVQVQSVSILFSYLVQGVMGCLFFKNSS